MSDLLLAKPKLPEGFIDVSVGEPYLIRDELLSTFNIQHDLKEFHLSDDDMGYPNPTGYQPLVEFLEVKHGAPVIVTNGAKQALGAVFYALSRLGKKTIGMRNPYWALIPPLAEMHGLESVYDRLGDAYLHLAPNNPDGFIGNIPQLEATCKEYNVPLIHDGAYYTHLYIERNIHLGPVGDVQIFSISKMLGLSGLRLGYAVCYNAEFYKLMQAYVEAMTVGVSIYSQMFLHHVLSEKMAKRPELVKEFEDNCRNQLRKNKDLCLNIDPEVLQVPKDVMDIAGMFGWFKVGPKADFHKAKLNFIDGKLFGMPGYVRMNLAFAEDKMKEIVKRLNG
jgi:aspartate/methionine/tyrosine aminotransferase